MRKFYSRIPAAALFREIDGHLYAYIPHRLTAGSIIEDFDNPRMVRFNQAGFIKNGEAYVYFGAVGALVNVGFIPFGVSFEDN